MSATDRSLYQSVARHLVILSWQQLILDDKGKKSLHVGTATLFLIEIQNQCFLFTAGHVLDAIERSFKEWPPTGLVLMDGHGALEPTECVPFAWPKRQTLHYEDVRTGTDIAFIKLGFMYTNLLAAVGTVPFTHAQWQFLPDQISAFYLLGMPRETVRIRPFSSGGQAMLNIRAPVPLIRLQMNPSPLIVPESPEFQMFFDLPPAGAELTGQAEVPNDIAGMSGGPIVAVSGSPNDFNVSLIGIQSRWIQSRRSIAATWVGILANAINQTLLDGQSEL